MCPVPETPRGMWFEEFEEGQIIVTAGRTITEADIVNFAGLSGDYNQIHVDQAFAEAAPFGQRVAHGLLGLSIASGLAVQTGVMAGTIMGFREIKNWKFSNPMFIGDTINDRLTVNTVKAMPRLGGGLVEIEMAVINQRDENVMKGTWSVLIQSKPAA